MSESMSAWSETWPLKSIQNTAAQECLCKGNIIPGGPCRHEIAKGAVGLIDVLVRALLVAEWPMVAEQYGPECQGCGNGVPWTQKVHRPGCPIDAALSAAGLPDQASRDAVRAEMEK